MDKFRVIVNIILIICVIAVVVSLAFVSFEKDEERTSQCKHLCINKNMEYFSYTVSGNYGTIFCKCLNNGIENKFALVEVDE